MAGNCKYYKQERYVSFDSGQTWSGTSVYRQGALIESASTDCGYVPPTPPHDYSTQYLTFRALEDGRFKLSGSSIAYSLDSGSTWASLSSNKNSPLVHSGETIMWRKRYGSSGASGGGKGFFVSTGRFEAEGNVMSLRYYRSSEATDDFSGQTSVSTLEFKELFKNCTGLTSAENMVVPATTLGQGCYQFMFYGCTNLTTAPTLPATTLTLDCYEGMFQYCSSLSSITCLATEYTATGYSDQWTYMVASNGTFYCRSGAVWASGENGIPNGWTRVNI